jgi:hypothetical protein
MSLPTKDITINENKYTIQYFGALKATKIQIKLIKICGSLLPLLFYGENKKSILDINLDDKFFGIFNTAISSLNESEAYELIKDLLSSCHVNSRSLGDEQFFNIWFSGKNTEMWKLIIEVIKTNFFSQTLTEG